MTADRRDGNRGRLELRRFILACIAVCGLAGCAPRLQEIGPDIRQPMLTDDSIVMPDGESLPLRRWLPAGKPIATVLALHGFNDYSRAFELPGEAWAKLGIATYAYDQRGFGETEEVGRWPGDQQLVDDMRIANALVNAQHPDVPHFVLGESMGGAVVMAAIDEGDVPDVTGAILVSPAVWGRDAQGPLAAGALWFFAHLVPWLPVSGEGFNVVPSDNDAMLRSMWQDPLVLKASRVDSIYGLTDLMDRSAAAVERLGPVPTLILYGANEDVMPTTVVTRALERLPKIGEARVRVAVYSGGYHMLLRDLEAEIVWQDIASWMSDPALALPSGADLTARRLLSNEDETLEDVATGGAAHGTGETTDPIPALARPRG